MGLLIYKRLGLDIINSFGAMVTIYQCEKCGQIFPEGGIICRVVDKCPEHRVSDTL